jgi:large conductance mechanosensitive channel
MFIAAIFGEPSFDAIGIDIGDDGARLMIGSVLTAIFKFVIVAYVCFLIVKAVNKAKGPEEEEVEADGPSEVDLLTEIRDQLRSNT